MFVKASVKKGFGVVNQSLVIVAVLSLFGFVWNLINIYFTPRLQNPSIKVSAIMIAASLVFISLSIFLQAGTLGYVRDTLKQGHADLAAFISVGTRYYFRLLLVGIIITLTVMIFVLLGALFVALLKNIGIVIAVLIGLAAIYVILLMFFAPYAVVIGDEKAVASI